MLFLADTASTDHFTGWDVLGLLILAAFIFGLAWLTGRD